MIYDGVITKPPLNEETLAHYGVMGMKWGIRKNPEKFLQKARKRKDKLMDKATKNLQKDMLKSSKKGTRLKVRKKN